MPTFYPIAKDGATYERYVVNVETDRVKPTGEKRAPKRGEWYLSGAIPEGYQAPNDLTHEYQICELVRGHFVWTPKNG